MFDVTLPCSKITRHESCCFCCLWICFWIDLFTEKVSLYCLFSFFVHKKSLLQTFKKQTKTINSFPNAPLVHATPKLSIFYFNKWMTHNMVAICARPTIWQQGGGEGGGGENSGWKGGVTKALHFKTTHYILKQSHRSLTNLLTATHPAVTHTNGSRDWNGKSIYLHGAIVATCPFCW